MTAFSMSGADPNTTKNTMGQTGHKTNMSNLHNANQTGSSMLN